MAPFKRNKKKRRKEEQGKRKVEPYGRMKPNDNPPPVLKGKTCRYLDYDQSFTHNCRTALHT